MLVGRVPPALLLGILAVWHGSAPGAVYVLDTTANAQVTNAKTFLTSLGYTLATGGALADYSGYEQVWDLRYDTALTAGDVSAMTNYLQDGGRMYLSGERPGAVLFNLRNASLINFLSGAGAGTVALTSTIVSGPQGITTAGAVVNSPNVTSTLTFSAAAEATSAGTGFLVTQIGTSSGRGSLLGWDFGDIASAPDARLLVGFDIEIFAPANGPNWTENMATYLGAPEPAAIIVWAGLGAMGFAGWRVRRRRALATTAVAA